MKLSDLNPGDVFRYLDGRPEFLNGLFMKMHQKNTYISPMTKKRCNFIISLDDGMPHNHADCREVEIVLKYRERIMENKMGRFIGWRFGVPVKVRGMNANSVCINCEKALLVFEDGLNFRVINVDGTFSSYHKHYYSYELIPYKSHHVPGPIYPVCQREDGVSPYLDGNVRDFIGKSDTLQPMSVATLTIDGKTIELSAETTAELKKKLGV